MGHRPPDISIQLSYLRKHEQERVLDWFTYNIVHEKKKNTY